MKNMISAFAFLGLVLSAQLAFSFPVYFCKMKFFDNRTFEGKVSSDLCNSVRAVYDNCRGEENKNVKIKNSDFICRAAVKERLECVDLTKNGEGVGADCSF